MNLSLEQLAARLEACEVDLEAHRGYIKGIEYGLRILVATHPDPAKLHLSWEHALVGAAQAHLGRDGQMFTAGIQQALRTLTGQIQALGSDRDASANSIVWDS